MTIRCMLLTMALLACTACGAARDTAARTTNTAQAVLAAVDDAWAPIVQAQIDAGKQLDDAAYKEHMATLTVVNDAIDTARQATQLLNLAVQVWDAQADGGAMFYETIPCVVQDLQLVRALLIPHQATAPPQLGQALTLIEAALGALAKPGSVCKRSGKQSAELVPSRTAEVSP